MPNLLLTCPDDRARKLPIEPQATTHGPGGKFTLQITSRTIDTAGIAPPKYPLGSGR